MIIELNQYINLYLKLNDFNDYENEMIIID